MTLSLFQDFLPSVLAGISCHCLFNRISCRLCWLKCRATISLIGFPAVCAVWNVVPLSLYQDFLPSVVTLSLYQDFLPSVLAEIWCHCLFSRISCRLLWLDYRVTVSLTGFPAVCAGLNIVPLSLYQDFLPSVVA